MKPPKVDSSQSNRYQRLSFALRQNLARRKEQKRGLETQEEDTDNQGVPSFTKNSLVDESFGPSLNSKS